MTYTLTALVLWYAPAVINPTFIATAQTWTLEGCERQRMEIMTRPGARRAVVLFSRCSPHP